MSLQPVGTKAHYEGQVVETRAAANKRARLAEEAAATRVAHAAIDSAVLNNGMGGSPLSAGWMLGSPSMILGGGISSEIPSPARAVRAEDSAPGAPARIDEAAPAEAPGTPIFTAPAPVAIPAAIIEGPAIEAPSVSPASEERASSTPSRGSQQENAVTPDPYHFARTPQSITRRNIDLVGSPASVLKTAELDRFAGVFSDGVFHGLDL